MPANGRWYLTWHLKGLSADIAKMILLVHEMGFKKSGHFSVHWEIEGIFFLHTFVL